MTIFIDLILRAGLVYLIIGLLFSFYFLLKGVFKLDDGVAETPWHFKLLIWPGSVLLWPVLTIKLRKND